MTTTKHSDELNHRILLGKARMTVELALASAERAVISSKFGPDSAVFLHFVTRLKPDIPIIRVETGYDTRATRTFVDDVQQRLDLDLHVFRPEAHVLRSPPALDDPDHPAFVEEVKLAPFRDALQSLDAGVWLSSIRRYQSAHRQGTSPFVTLPSGVLKVSPFLDWSADTVARYAREHELERGPDVFDPTKGEPFRECGLHTALGA